MGLRFRRWVRLAHGLEPDLSASGPGLTLEGGPPPPDLGTGIRLDLEPDGRITLYDEAGLPLSQLETTRVRREYGAALREWLALLCERWNRENNEIVNPHHSTPDPASKLELALQPFDEPPPDPYIPPEPTLLDLSWPPQRKRYEEEVATGKRAYEEELWRWRRRRSEHEAREEQRRRDLEIGRYGDRVIMESFLVKHLEGLDWPVETNLAFEISLDTTTLFLDLSAPGLDLVPARQASPARRGLRVLYSELSEAQVRRRYATYLHGLLFRLVGETFIALPGVEKITASVLLDRPAEIAPGVTIGSDPVFLVSAQVEREGWMRIDFDHLEELDLVAVFQRFELRRKLTKHGVFTPIEPFGPVEIGGLFDPRALLPR